MRPKNFFVLRPTNPTRQRGSRFPRASSLALRVTGAAVFVAVLAATASDCLAVVIFLKGQNEPVMGFLIRETDTNVTIDEPDANGVRKTRVIPKSSLENILYTVKPERLEALVFTDPAAYRSYAEELAEKRQDPEARETAIRLYLCAAHLDPEKLGRGSMLGLINLARNEQEEVKFRAMAYLIDPEHDQRVLTRPDTVAVRPTGVGEQARERLLKALKMIRSGRGVAAKQVLDFPDVLAAFEFFETVLSVDDFRRACSLSEIPGPLLEKLVRMELALMPNSSVSVSSVRSDNEASELSWRKAIRRDGLAPVPALSLENLTEFNPQLCQYREGNWVKPT